MGHGDDCPLSRPGSAEAGGVQHLLLGHAAMPISPNPSHVLESGHLGMSKARHRHAEPQGEVGANTLYSVLASDWLSPAVGASAPWGTLPLSYETILQDHTVTSLHSHDVFWDFFFQSFFFCLFCCCCFFLKKEKKRKEKKRRKSARKAQRRSTKLRGGSWWLCQRRERVRQRPAETLGGGPGGLWDHVFLRFVCVNECV